MPMTDSHGCSAAVNRPRRATVTAPALGSPRGRDRALRRPENLRSHRRPGTAASITPGPALAELRPGRNPTMRPAPPRVVRATFNANLVHDRPSDHCERLQPPAPHTGRLGVAGRPSREDSASPAVFNRLTRQCPAGAGITALTRSGSPRITVSWLETTTRVVTYAVRAQRLSSLCPARRRTLVRHDESRET
jgi:hypothetical protein